MLNSAAKPYWLPLHLLTSFGANITMPQITILTRSAWGGGGAFDARANFD